jgi:hypothetical protein
MKLTANPWALSGGLALDPGLQIRVGQQEGQRQSECEAGVGETKFDCRGEDPQRRNCDDREKQQQDERPGVARRSSTSSMR